MGGEVKGLRAAAKEKSSGAKYTAIVSEAFRRCHCVPTVLTRGSTLLGYKGLIAMPTLTVQLPGAAPVSHVLKDETSTVGRMKGNTVVIEDGSISLMHARITRKN